MSDKVRYMCSYSVRSAFCQHPAAWLVRFKTPVPPNSDAGETGEQASHRCGIHSAEKFLPQGATAITFSNLRKAQLSNSHLPVDSSPASEDQ